MASLRPNEILGVESAALGNATTLLASVGFIVGKAREVYHFRKDCLELANSCIVLAAAFTDAAHPRDTIKSQQEFCVCLHDVQLFVDECSQANIIHVAWEVIGARKLAGLKARLISLKDVMDTELLIKVKGDSSETVQSLMALRTDVNSIRNTVQDAGTERIQYLGRIKSLEDDLEGARRDLRSLNPLPTPAFPITTLPDPSVQTTKTFSDGPITMPLEGIFKGKPVEFKKLPNDSTKRIPRIKKIYEQITGLALVQELFCIVDSDGTRLVMMESMSAHQQTESAVKNGFFASLGSIHVLRYAYELAATVSALHAAHLVIKVISDQTVYVEKRNDGSIRPKLAGLDQARALWEVTSQTPQDVRFESPETTVAGTRSKMADMWSLGIMLHEIFLQQLPYGFTNSDVATPTNAEQVRTRLRNRDRIFEEGSSITEGFQRPMRVVRECLARDPFLRPTAASLAQQLFEELILAASQAPEISAAASIETPALVDFEVLGRRILSAPSIKFSPDGSSSHEFELSSNSISSGEFNQLVQASRTGNPSMLYLVGLAYLKNLVNATEGSVSIAQSRDAANAKAAIPFLQQAEELGHDGAIKELLRAHKLLAKHYYDVISTH